MDHDKVMEFLGPVRDRPRRDRCRRPGGDRQPARPLPRARAGPGDAPSSSPSAPGYHLRYLTEWLRGQAAGGYISYDPATGEFSLTDEQAFCLADPNGPEPVRRRSAPCWATCARNRSSPRRSAPARASAGTSTTRTSSSGATPSTAPATWPSWCRAGSPRWTASRRSLPRAAGSPTSAAGSVRPRCWSPRPTRRAPSSARTTTPSRSSWPGRRPPRPASVTGSASRWPRRRPSPATTTTW